MPSETNGRAAKEAKNFTTSIVVSKTPAEVFAAVNNVRGWWSGDIAGKTDSPGAEFTFRYKKLHRSTHRITEFVKDKKVTWHTTKAMIAFVKDKTEWNGTDIAFEISPEGHKTRLTFTHAGLVPSIECYDDCSGAWDFYIGESLKKLIETGTGEPE